MAHPIKVLIAKPGLDGHDRGARIVVRTLREAGMDVIYSGLRQTPDQIVRTAIQADVDCVGLSCLSGAHNTLFPQIIQGLRDLADRDVLVIGGGIIPHQDIPYLRLKGVAHIFTQGTPLADAITFIQKHVKGNQAVG